MSVIGTGEGVAKDRPGRLGAPRYPGPGRPIKVQKPQELPHYKKGRLCGQCVYGSFNAEAREYLSRTGFWDRLFHGHDDGTDIKPHHVGNPEDYGLCSKREAAVHCFSTCRYFRDKDKNIRSFSLFRALGKMIGR